jgi:hypothetical protein
MATKRQTAAAKKNIKKTASPAKRAQTIAHLPKRPRTELSKQASHVKKRKAEQG